MTPSRRPTSSVARTDAFTREELRRLAKAERKAASVDEAVAAAGRREIQEVGRRREQRQTEQSLADRLAETAALARARGEEVRVESLRIATPLIGADGAHVIRSGAPMYRSETVSRVRVASRGGLQLAYERGDLDGGPVTAERLLEIGQRYRWAFETATARTTPRRDLAPIASRVPTRGGTGPQEAVFVAGELLRTLRHGLAVRQVAVLDQVCGLDDSIRAAASVLKADPRTVRRALVDALSQADANRRAASSELIITRGDDGCEECA